MKIFTRSSTIRFQCALWVWLAVLFLERIARKGSFTLWNDSQEFHAASIVITICVFTFLLSVQNVYLLIAAIIAQLISYELLLKHGHLLVPTMLHWFMGILIALLLLMSFVFTLLSRPKDRALAFTQNATPILKGFFIIGLTFLGFSKLNSAFLNPELSCTSSMLEIAQNYLPFLPLNNSFKQFVAVIVFLIEFLGPLLLVYRPTRDLALLTIGTLLFFLGAVPIYSLYEFAGQFFALLLLFIESRSYIIFMAKIRYTCARIPKQIWLVSIFLLGALCGLSDRSAEFLPFNNTCQVLWYLFFIMFLVLLTINSNQEKLPLTLLPKNGRMCAVVFYIVLIMKESLTYLGMPHYPSFAVASGLVVNTRYSNHLLIRSIPETNFNRPTRDTANSLKRGLALYPEFLLTWYESSIPTIAEPAPVNSVGGKCMMHGQ